MKKRVYAIVVGIAFGLAAGGVSHAMSHQVAIAIKPEPTAASDPGSVMSYKYRVTLTRTGSGVLNVSLSSSGLPEGATATFSPNLVRFTGRVPETLTSTLTITGPNVTPTTTCTFTVTGESRREVVTVTNQFPPELPTPPLRFPVLFAPDQPGTEGIKVRGKGSIGATYQIEATSDLSNPSWCPIGLSIADGDGLFSLLDAQAKDLPARFYRALLLAPDATAVPKP